MKPTINKRRAFTLIELLVVVAIIVALLAILVPSLNRAIETAKLAVCASNLHQTGNASLSYAADQQRFLPTLQRTGEPVNRVGATHYAYMFTNLHGTNEAWDNLGLLYRTSAAPDPRVFYCPSQRSPAFQYEEMAGWWEDPSDPSPSVQSNPRAGYMWNPRVSLSPDPDRMRLYTSVTNLPSSGLLATDMLHGTGYTAHQLYPGWNILRGDGSVRLTISREFFDAYPTYGHTGAGRVLYEQGLEDLERGD